MARIQGYTEDDLDVLIADFEGVVEESLRSVARGVADNLRPAVTAASSAGLGPADVMIAQQLWQEEVDGVITPYVGEVYTGSAVQVAIGLGDSFPDGALPGIPLVADEFAVTYMKTVTNRLSGVGNEVWEDIRNELLDGIHDGLSVEQIADRIANLANFEETRAHRIARTEIHAASESGSLAQMLFMGYDQGTVTKEWISTRDGRTRETHKFANGQQVGLDEMFLVGLSHLQFPGDPSGAPGETINCRCTTTFEVDEPPKFRCGDGYGNLVAATTGVSSHCVVPTPQANISHIAEALREALFTAFMLHKISPAFGGAKIHKVLADVRDTVGEGQLTGIDDFQILQVVDHKYTGAAKGSYLGKYTEWLQTPAGKKASGGVTVPKPATHVVAPTNIDVNLPPTTQPGPAVGFAPLPPVPSQPALSDLTFTGKVFATASKAEVWVDSSGRKWLFKPIKGQSYSSKFLVEIDIATSRLASKALMQRPGVYEVTLGGKHGTLQSMFDSVDAFPGGSFDPLKLSAEDLLVMQREQIFDWLISNHDTHSGQWVRTSTGQLVGIDKGQSYKFFGHDKLDWAYTPVTPLGGDKLTYSSMWKAFVAGKNIDLHDPTQGPLGDYMLQLMSIPDDEFKALLRPYFESRVAQGMGTDVEKFLDMAVKRKNNLKKDFSAFYAKAVKARQQSGGVPSPTPAVKVAAKKAEPFPISYIPAKPATPLPVSIPTPAVVGVDLGDISGVSLSTKQFIALKWVDLGGGKKVTPGWGGSKIWKLLTELEADTSIPDVAGLNHLQLLRILDEMGGFKGKPKTYESVLIEWLESPAGMKVVKPGSVTSLKKTVPAAKAAPTPTPSAKSPSAIQGKFAGDEVTPGELSYWYMNETTPNSVGATWTFSGDQYRVILKMDSTGFTKAYIERFNAVTGEWFDVKSVYNLTELYQYELKAAAKDLVTPTPVTPVVPVSNAVKTVNDLPSGSVITTEDIHMSSFGSIWEEDDVFAVGTSTAAGVEYRIIAKPSTPNKYVIQYKTAMTHWNNTASALDDAWVKAATWKVPGTSGISPPAAKMMPTKVYGKGPDDSVTPAELGLNAHLFEDGDIMATAVDPFTKAQWRVLYDGKGGGGYKFEIKTTGGDWTPTTAMTAPVEHYDWKLTGDVLINKTKSKLPGKNVGDKLTGKDVWDLAWGNVSQGDVIAYAWDDTTGTMYRLLLDFDGDMKMGTLAPSGKWNPASIVYAEDDIANMDWYVAHPTKLEIPDPLKVYAQTPVTAPPFTPKSPLASPKKAKAAAKKAAATQAALKPPLSGTATHIPGKSVGDPLAKDEIMKHASKYADGEVVAQYTTKGWNKESFRLVWTDDGLVKQKQLSSGAWKSEDVIGQGEDWKLYGQWEAANGLATKPQITAMKKFITKKTGGYVPPAKKAAYTPHVAPTPSATYPTLTQGQLAHVDLTLWDGTEQAEIVDYLAGLNPSSTPEIVWGKLQQAKSHFAAKYKGKYLGLNELEILRMLDAANALKGGKTDLHILEAKIVNWLQTANGKFFTSRRIDAPIMSPDVPVPVSAYADYGPPDSQQYDVISTSQALAYRAESHAKYGDWKPGEKEATKVYTGGSYTAWNDAIRKGDLKSYKSKIYATQRGMRPSTRPILLHRGTSFLEFNDPSITSYESLLPYVGRTYVNRGFNSTSVGGNPAFGGQLLIEYEAPAGTPMSYVDDFSHHKGEREMLLPTHMTYEIISVTKKSSTTTVMRVRVLGPATP
jgi:hypothetical protein